MIKILIAHLKTKILPEPLLNTLYYLPDLGRIYKLHWILRKEDKIIHNDLLYQRSLIILLLPLNEEFNYNHTNKAILNKDAIIFTDWFSFYYYTTKPTSKQLPLFDEVKETK